jgi:threonine-phosphate decarboxylase
MRYSSLTLRMTLKKGEVEITVKKVGEHGGNIYKASECLNRRIEDILDFSANINPLGIPETLKEVLFSNVDSLVHYPDPEYTRLYRRLSEYTGIPSECIIAGNGSSEIIYLLLKVLKPESILIPAPSFSEYEKASSDAGIDTRFFELREDECFKLNLERLKHEIVSGIKCVIFCNPNNPTSSLLSAEKAQHIVEFASRHGVTVIVDEAFIELTVGRTHNSIAGLVNRFDNLFVIRAFTKVFAVPGLRLGYGIGNEQMVKGMRMVQQPWTVNSLAACSGDFLPESGKYLQKTQEWLKAEKEWLYKSMSVVFGLKVFEPHTNFILAKLVKDDMDVGILRESLAKRGILIRNASNFRFLDGRFFRVAVRDRTDNQYLVDALQDILN